MKKDSGSVREFFCVYNLDTLISSLKILPVLLQKYVVSPFRDFRESQNLPFSSLLISSSPNHYMTYLDHVLSVIVKDDFNIAYFRFEVRIPVSFECRGGGVHNELRNYVV